QEAERQRALEAERQRQQQEQQAEAARLAAEAAEQEEAERLAAEREEAERLAAEREEAERLAAERRAAEQRAAEERAAEQRSAAAAAAPAELRPISTPAPRYPLEALRAGQAGEVLVEFTVNPDGSVSNARVVRADPPRVFDREAVAAVRRWRFEPAAEATTTRRVIGFNPGQ